MRLDIKGIASKARRRIRRGALPSSLMGLVAFAFTLVAFGTAAYTSSLPALVMARSRAGESGLFHTVMQAVMGGGLPGESAAGHDGDTESQKDETAALGTNAAANTDGVASSRPGFALGGASLQGIIDNVAQGTKPQPDQPGGNDSGGSQQGGSGDAGGQNPGGGQGGTDPDPAPEPEQAGPSPQEEQAAYEFLLAKAQKIDGYVAEVNACVQAFNNDCLADLATRRAHSGTCGSLSARLFADFEQTVNTTVVTNESMYKDAHGSLIGMFRCLLGYLGTIQEAWEINILFDDPAAHVDEFMAPVHRDTVNGQNKHLTEFYGYYEGFEL